MKGFLERTFRINNKVVNFSMFLATALILILFFPRGGKFKYEYQRGKPWMHEVLIAPFDFPIYKSESDLSEQKDSITKSFTPYFNYNPKSVIEQKNKFRTFFNNYWNYLNRKYPNILKPEYKNRLEKQIIFLFDFIYNKGIIELPEGFNALSKKSIGIKQVRNNVAEECELDEVFTQKRAYEYIFHDLSRFTDQISDSTGFNPDAFFRGLRLDEFVVPNLYYDEETTSKMREAAISELSLTEGMVLTGERVIFTGDIVTTQSYKVLESLKKEYEFRMGKSSNYIFILIGQAILSFICILIIYIFLKKFRKPVLQSKKKVAFILFVVLLFSLSASLVISFKPYSLYMVPFAILPILLKTFYDTKLALFIHIVTVLIIGFWAPNSFEFSFLTISIGIVALLSLTNIYRRNKMFVTSAWIIATYISLHIGISLYQEGNISNIKIDNLLSFGGNGLLVLSSIPLIYIFEKMFGFLSDATLLELSDSNQPLLRRLAELAPGTFQHSLQVANLAEEATFKIGGNPLLVRAGALYHDIGKIDSPIYYIENLSDELNPHENLSFEESVAIIVSHVPRGIEIAHRSRLPLQIIDFISTHHGTSLVYYFYRNYIKKFPSSEVDIKSFSYPGPKPFSRETAILMMADSIEAASRSLKYYNEKDLNILVDSIINNQLKDGQLNDANITLKEIESVKATFKKRLRTIYHVRIEYPK